jgi:hypothetical protein
VATRLINKTEDFHEKVAILCRAFATHLKSLKYATRPVEDWVTDTFLNPACYAEFFSIADCIREFGNGFEFLGSSPSMFTNYSWYKDTEFNERNSILTQFCKKRHLLILWDIDESIRTAEVNDELHKAAYELRCFAGKIQGKLTEENMARMVDLLRYISQLASDIDGRISPVIDEAITLLTDDDLNEPKVANAKKFGVAFGRGQQYVSLVKRFLK